METWKDLLTVALMLLGLVYLATGSAYFIVRLIHCDKEGIQGPPGPRGPMGPMGPKGDKGDKGDSWNEKNI